MAGSTPTVDVGAITEDGISIELTAEQRAIMQGNPKLIELKFTQAQGIMVTVTSIEWNFESLRLALASGNTTVSGTQETFAWGGEPCTTEVALHIQHVMCISGNTINAHVWRAVGEGNTTLPFTHDEHQFPYKFEAIRAPTDWDGASLPLDEQLIQVQRAL